MKRFILIATAFLLVSLEVHSQSFTARLGNGEQLCFQVTDTTQRTVEIIRVKMLGTAQVALPSGDLSIPSTVKYKDKAYTVVSLGDDAFAGAENLRSVSIPSSVKKIGDRAFSECSSLASVVFPSRMPSIGANAFEKCHALSAVSFGSDWTAVELQLFADAESLKEIFIPARVNKITGVKRIASLERILVDSNNRAFSSHDGMLYSKDGLTLYACPCAKSEKVSVLSGTEAILEGAFSDCSSIESIVLPSSVHEFAYDEFSGCPALKTMVLLSEVPPVTAKWNGAAVFAVKAPGHGFLIQVPKQYLNRYKESICSSEGLYQTVNGNRKAEIKSGDLSDKSSVRKEK